MNTYEEKKQARVERYEALAEKHRAAADAACARAHEMADAIPFGQPILVGHHSEGRDRRYRERIRRTYDKGHGEYKKSEYYAQKARGAASNSAISSDDPEAVGKLRERVEKLEALQERLKACNKIVKSRRRDYPDEEKIRDLVALGLAEETATKLLNPANFGGPGVPAYELSNNSANIRRLKQRIEELEQAGQDETTEIVIGEVRILDSVEENRVQVFFPGKPDEGTRKRLKSSGFRWSPRNGCWQSYRGERYLSAAKTIVS